MASVPPLPAEPSSRKRPLWRPLETDPLSLSRPIHSRAQASWADECFAYSFGFHVCMPDCFSRRRSGTRTPRIKTQPRAVAAREGKGIVTCRQTHSQTLQWRASANAFLLAAGLAGGRTSRACPHQNQTITFPFVSGYRCGGAGRFPGTPRGQARPSRAARPCAFQILATRA